MDKVQNPSNSKVRDLHTAFNLPCVYDYNTKSCRQHAEFIENHENEHVRGIGKGGATHRIYKFGGGYACDSSSDMAVVAAYDK
jgi:hypothetical protein